jgi:hypothetical protein
VGPSGALLGTIRVPRGSTSNFNFSTATSTLPASFGTFVVGLDNDSKFTIDLSGGPGTPYSISNFPVFIVTGYVYSSTAGYTNVQRQFGVQSATAAASMTINSSFTTLTFRNLTDLANFPATANDGAGYALYIQFQILN